MRRANPELLVVLLLFAGSGACTVSRSGLATGEATAPDATVDLDGGACDPAACDDGLDCTVDSCGPTDDCVHRPDDARCTGGAAGRCDSDLGCIYEECGGRTCVAPNRCMRATCVDGECRFDAACSTDEFCCAGRCHPVGCDDGNPCTEGRCDVDFGGCAQDPVDGRDCNDQQFCTGTDVCMGGECQHAGDPCRGRSICAEDRNSCVGCRNDNDCPTDTVSGWSACDFGGSTCREEGSRSRSITTYRCDNDECVSTTTVDSETCTRDTEGSGCGFPTCTASTACGGFADECDETGTQTLDCTDFVCRSGTCQMEGSSRIVDCRRSSTDGSSCDDGNPCNGDDSCMDEGCAVHAGDPCTATMQMCDPVSGACVDCVDDVDCDDGDSCTMDVCSSGSCQNDAITDCCTGNNECNGGTVCDLGTNRCVDCLVGGDCSGSCNSCGMCMGPGQSCGWECVSNVCECNCLPTTI